MTGPGGGCDQVHRLEPLDILPGPDETVVVALVDGTGVQLWLNTRQWAEAVGLEPDELRRVLWTEAWPPALEESLSRLLIHQYHVLRGN